MRKSKRTISSVTVISATARIKETRSAEVSEGTPNCSKPLIRDFISLSIFFTPLFFVREHPTIESIYQNLKNVNKKNKVCEYHTKERYYLIHNRQKKDIKRGKLFSAMENYMQNMRKTYKERYNIK